MSTAHVVKILSTESSFLVLELGRLRLLRGAVSHPVVGSKFEPNSVPFFHKCLIRLCNDAIAKLAYHPYLFLSSLRQCIFLVS